MRSITCYYSMVIAIATKIYVVFVKRINMCNMNHECLVEVYCAIQLCFVHCYVHSSMANVCNMVHCSTLVQTSKYYVIWSQFVATYWIWLCRYTSLLYHIRNCLSLFRMNTNLVTSSIVVIIHVDALVLMEFMFWILGTLSNHHTQCSCL